MSLSSARRAEKLGYINVKVLQNGVPAWKEAGKPLYSTTEYLLSTSKNDQKVVLIDVRDAEEAQMAHIDNAVSIPLNLFVESRGKFPTDKNATLVLYGKSSEDCLALLPLVRSWGYLNVTVLQGGFDNWRANGFPIQHDTPATTITHVPSQKSDGLSIDAFKKVVQTKDPNVILLDVRSDEEVEKGKIPGALAIPVDELTERIDEVPRNKRIFAYCSAGVRSEMAYLILKKRGYDVSYLDAAITITRSGDYRIFQ